VVLHDPADAAVSAGVVAEAVPGVHDAEMTELAPAPATLPAEAAALLRGQLSDAQGPLAVLSVEALLGLRDRVDRRRHGG
jgi:chemotaxis signal transduction protein